MSKDVLYPLRLLHGKMHEYIRGIKEKRHFRRLFDAQKKRYGKCVFLVLTPEHTNLGDHAIALAETQLLREQGIGYIEVTGKSLSEWKQKRILNLMNKCPIMINGGGNLGTLWFDVEELMRDVVKHNPKSPICIMPNTIFYEDSDYGREEFERSKDIYNAHRNLTIYAREQISFDNMKGQYNRVFLTPDMVMFLNRCKEGSVRKGCMVCLRKDLEKTISQESESALIAELKTIFSENISFSDTHANHDVPIADRDTALEKKFAEFRSAELVVTDRLHGMVFCAITGTPCIVINSQSPKVKGCYEWIKHLDYIQFCDDVNEIVQIYESIPKKEHHYDNEHLMPYYQTLSQDIVSQIQG